ncbi:hypothetical protein CUR178_03032 [Leishmania enriettii]|uniref:ubiquitinyl hydrolase 1 n=1 Tax=Leishmania enriettii TaxID=5663 RepID=A0A836GGB0_LEIEN|nr:hypothetical protein CUR178_03032 [Leishmania enriettii]
MLCSCVEDVDLDVFRGIFIEQWLSGKRQRSCQEALFFCTTCGPPAVQESIKGSSGSGSPGTKPYTPEKKSSSGKSTFGNTLKKLFGASKNSSKGDLSNIASKQHSSGHVRESSMRVMSAEEEELPTTPRTEKELYLCVTCGSCYCRDHACDHHYSRQQRSTVAGFDDSEALQKGYPYHSFFIGVPSFVSTHPSHVLQETSWGLLFPTVTVREIEEGTVDLSKPLPFYEHFEEICDARAACGACAPHLNGSSASNSHSFSRGRNALCLSPSAAHTRVSSAYSNSSHLDGLPRVHSKTNSYADRKEDRPPTRQCALLTPVGSNSFLSLPEFHSSPPENWSYLMFCAKCTDRQPSRLHGKQCDNEISRHVHLRRLGQLTALLAYFLLRGVRLDVPVQFLEYSRKKHAQQVERQRSQQRSQRLVEMQRVGRASELVGGLEGIPTAGAAHASATGGDVDVAAPHMCSYGLLSRTETDRVITRAAICGFSNESYFCYMNSVLQCLLRCRNFAGPLLHLDLHKSPGKLTTSMSRLIHQVSHQTYQDVRNGAVFAFVRSLRAQICSINVLFEEDEQQDAQEFLITLLNGIGDEFDKGKTEEEKKATRRVSFEGTLLSEVTCSQCKHCVPRNEMFMSLSIPIEKSIEDGIASLFAPTTLRGKDRYACEGCFQRLSQREQQGHNALAAAQAEAERRAKLAGKKLTKEQIEGRVYANALYSEAEVRTSLSHLGGSLAVHLLRFHYDPEVQDFIKVLTPVRISLTLDLTPYVSCEVVEAYRRMEKVHLLQRRFPNATRKVLDKYLRRSKDDVKVATQRMLDDGHGIAEATHSRQSSSAAVSRCCTGLGASNTIGDEGSEDVAGVGSVFGDACDGTSSSSATPHNNPNGDLGFFAKAGANLCVSAGGTGGRAAASELAALSAASVCAITRDEFDPFGERTSSKPSLVRHLVGIVAHRGSLHGGHYIAYVRHLTRPHVWFRCDDDDIDVVEEKFVLEHESEVYLAFYE